MIKTYIFLIFKAKIKLKFSTMVFIFQQNTQQQAQAILYNAATLQQRAQINPALLQQQQQLQQLQQQQQQQASPQGQITQVGMVENFKWKILRSSFS